MRSPLSIGLGNGPSQTHALREAALTARGTHFFPTRNSPVFIGRTGVTVTVSDLHLAPNAQRPIAGEITYRLPAWSRAGAATVTGNPDADQIAVTQDDRGDTIIAVTHTGLQASLNLGRIAALTLHGNGGDDELSVKVSDYFGGVTIVGGEGNDTITAEIERALQRGVTIRGDAGADTISLSGAALRSLIAGGAGNDILAAATLPTTAFRQQLQGDDGDDILTGSPGADDLTGGPGADRLFGREGADQLAGMAGADWLAGGAGHDRLLGGDDADIVLGGAGDDQLQGNADDDQLYAGAGTDELKGGAGRDAFAPNTVRPFDLSLQERLVSRLKVGVRGETRAQSMLAGYRGNDKRLLDYQTATDALLDRRYVV